MLVLLHLIEYPYIILSYMQNIFLFYFFFKCIIILFLMTNTPNPLIAILYFILFFFINLNLLLLLGLDFFTLISLLIYIGAIAILFIFVIMLLDIRFTLNYLNKYSLFNFFILGAVVIFIIINNFILYNNFIYDSDFYQNWVNLLYFKPITENIGFFITNLYYVHLLLIGIILSLVLIILLSFILTEKYSNFNKNYMRIKYKQYKRLLL